MSVTMMETNMKQNVTSTKKKTQHRRMKHKNMIDYVKRAKKKEIDRAGTSRRK